MNLRGRPRALRKPIRLFPPVVRSFGAAATFSPRLMGVMNSEPMVPRHGIFSLRQAGTEETFPTRGVVGGLKGHT